MDLKWENGFSITIKIHEESVIISANREGLVSMANHFIALSQEQQDTHIHLDKYNSLEDDSVELIVEKLE